MMTQEEANALAERLYAHGWRFPAGYRNSQQWQEIMGPVPYVPWTVTLHPNVSARWVLLVVAFSRNRYQFRVVTRDQFVNKWQPVIYPWATGMMTRGWMQPMIDELKLDVPDWFKDTKSVKGMRQESVAFAAFVIYDDPPQGYSIMPSETRYEPGDLVLTHGGWMTYSQSLSADLSIVRIARQVPDWWEDSFKSIGAPIFVLQWIHDGIFTRKHIAFLTPVQSLIWRRLPEDKSTGIDAIRFLAMAMELYNVVRDTVSVDVPITGFVSFQSTLPWHGAANLNTTIKLTAAQAADPRSRFTILADQLEKEINKDATNVGEIVSVNDQDGLSDARLIDVPDQQGDNDPADHYIGRSHAVIPGTVIVTVGQQEAEAALQQCDRAIVAEFSRRLGELTKTNEPKETDGQQSDDSDQ